MPDKDYIIDDSTNPNEFVSPGFARGLIPRDYSTYPVPLGALQAFDMPLIPRSEWVERIQFMDANKARLSDLREVRGPNDGYMQSLDQNGQGYCWGHSVIMCLMLLRARMGLPYVRLSAFHPCCIIKNYKDEGGWGAQALDFVIKNGCASVEFWPEKSMSKNNDTPEMREDALQYRVSESWQDLSAPQYDRNLTEDQAMTCLLSSLPVIGDFNWWGHSVCLMDPTIDSAGVNKVKDVGSLDLNNDKDLQVYEAAFGKRGINSWTDSWGERGEFVLTGSKARLDGGGAPRVAYAA